MSTGTLGEPRRRFPDWLRPTRWLSFLDLTLARRFGSATREDRLFLVAIVAAGVVSGVLGWAVHQLMEGLGDLLWGSEGELVERVAALPWWRSVVALVGGGLLVGLLVALTRKAPRSGGMSGLIEAVALTGGRVGARPVLVEVLLGVATVGSGGSLGREGPLIRLGAMISSRLGTRFALPPHRVKVLVGCGAAAGLAAVYNIPVGGALFAMEVILGNFALEIFGPIVASSVISTLIARSLLGDVHLFPVTTFELASPWELLAYAGLGLVAAGMSVVFVLGVRSGRFLFRGLSFLPRACHPLVGFAALAALALPYPHVLGGGAEVIPLLLGGAVPLPLLLGLPLVKLLATSLTRASGGSGGLFTPSLLFGAAVGALYGTGLEALLPAGVVAPPQAYAAVGMAALSAGISHAPISAILILFELTGNYDLILPLMVAAITASLGSRRLYRYSVYTEPLARKGVDLSWRMGEAVLAGLKVTDLSRTDGEVLPASARYREVVERFLASHRQRLFVVDSGGRLRGAVSIHDIKGTLDRPEALISVVADDLAVPVELTLAPESTLSRAAQAFSRSDYERLPVVDADGTFRGVLTKRDLLAVYAQEVLGRPAMLATFVRGGAGSTRDYVELPPDFALRLVPVPAELAGQTLAQARLPQRTGARVIEIKRRSPRGGDERVIPVADTVLEATDQLIVLGPTTALEALEQGRLPVRDEAEAIRVLD